MAIGLKESMVRGCRACMVQVWLSGSICGLSSDRVIKHRLTYTSEFFKIHVQIHVRLNLKKKIPRDLHSRLIRAGPAYELRSKSCHLRGKHEFNYKKIQNFDLYSNIILLRFK